MNNRYLYKAKRMSDGAWISGGSIIQFLDNGIRSFYMPQFNEKYVCTHDDVTSDILGFESCRFYKVDRSTVCRCIGSEDKNGKLIWENDICIIRSNPIDEEDGYFTVSWDNDGARFKLESDEMVFDFDSIHSYECEVVGNIFDNPELLEGEVIR